MAQRIFQLYIHTPDPEAIPDIDTSAEALALSWTTCCVVKATLNRASESEDVTDTCSGGKKEERPTYDSISIEAEGIIKRDASDDVPTWLSALDNNQTNRASTCFLLLDGPRTVEKSRGYYLLGQVLDLTEDFDVAKAPRFKLKVGLDGTVTGINKYLKVTVPAP